MSFSFLGFLSIICALLITVNKEKYKWLVAPAGFKQKPNIAIAFYSILGALLMLSSIVNNPYITNFILPVFVICLCLLTILVINAKGSKSAS
ncbi:hypothetical protein FS935_01115 [Metabacillus litoralis]|uniref:DUF3784 domain-containing protein n=1 Tax=Metabacillus litoralis TaxID=152268 RepID=A0A5C6W8R8_9BACI|nr:hypothetical protein [Metabacillus litoralis]TXC92828.1 hypothetical protein FS935_01115 [Metabacillus litoralis]